MKLYLDDMRIAPDGWILASNPGEAIVYLQSGNVEIISLDHDLGENCGNGKDVLNWIMDRVINNGFVPPEILIHTDNPAEHLPMKRTAERIWEIYLNMRKLNKTKQVN